MLLRRERNMRMEKDLKECTEIFSRNGQSFSGVIVTDRYRGVLLHFLFASSSLTGKAGFWIEKSNFWTSAQIILHKTDRESQKIFLTVSFYLARQLLLGRPCPSPHSPTWPHCHCELLKELNWGQLKKPKSLETQLLSHSATDHMVSLGAHLGQNFTIAKSLWDSSWAQLSQLSASVHHHQLMAPSSLANPKVSHSASDQWPRPPRVFPRLVTTNCLCIKGHF